MDGTLTHRHNATAPHCKGCGVRCAVCGARGKLIACPSCRSSYYCSELHRQTHATGHRAKCEAVQDQLRLNAAMSSFDSDVSADTPPPLFTPTPPPGGRAGLSSATPNRKNASSTLPPLKHRGATAAAPAALTSEEWRAEYGRASWTVLHGLAEKFPARPSTEQQRSVQLFIHSFAEVYPCDRCAVHFRHHLADDPPTVQSGKALRDWMCSLHNKINAQLGKPCRQCK